jgi:hypothetical protein
MHRRSPDVEASLEKLREAFDALYAYASEKQLLDRQ